jgi:hypothetical protein
VTKLRTTLTITVAVIFFSLSLYLYLGNREKPLDEDVEVGARVYQNKALGYQLNYPPSWEIREKRDLSYFYSERTDVTEPQTSINLETYKQMYGVDLIGTSPLNYIDGTINYNIEKEIYPNLNNFTVRQWYDVAVLLQNYNAQKIRESDFIKIGNKILKEGAIVEDKDKIFDPWTPEGEVINIGSKDVLKVIRSGDSRYEGYQYYIVSFSDYIFVFHFGYGGLVVPREMWQRSNNHMKGIIWSLKPLN